MTGRITKDTCVRQRPHFNAAQLEDLYINDIIGIKDIVEGEEKEANDEWYLLDWDRTAYVWSGAAEVDSSPLSFPDSEDFIHYLISFRKIDSLGRPDDSSKEIPDKLSFQRVVLPATYKSLEMSENENDFIDRIIADVGVLDQSKKHVFIYVPGYQPVRNLGLSLWSDFVRNYMSDARSSIAKVLFFTWPNHELGRKTIDDRANEAGKLFAEKELYSFFVKLSERLLQEGKTLSLILHSFAHQVLNGFLTSNITYNSRSKIFHRVFLMAPDIVQGAFNVNGITVKNYHVADGGESDIHFNLNNIRHITKSTHIFYDEYDYLLHTSTKKAAKPLENDIIKIKDYRNLGNYGCLSHVPPDVYQYNLQELLKTRSSQKRDNNFIFKNLADKNKLRNKMNDVISGAKGYNKIGDFFAVLFNAGKFTKHHRYLFTSRVVVEEVISILNDDSHTPSPLPLV